MSIRRLTRRALQPLFGIESTRGLNRAQSVGLVTVLTSVCTLALAGCGASTQEAGQSDLTPLAHVSVAGKVHGGAFPIQGATVRLMRTSTSWRSTYGSTAVQLDSTTSAVDGSFNFAATDTYTCPSGEFAYITVTGGHSTDISRSASAPANTNLVQVGVVGSCSFMAANYNTLEIFVSELSTVAAAYALGNFMTVDDSNASSTGQIVNIGAPKNNNVASGSCSGTGANRQCTAAGLAHAFANAYDLVDSVSTKGVLPSGQARANSPSNSAAIVPQALINTLGNILQNCVDSATTDSYCSTLFSTANFSGKAPTNTLEVALQLAKYPAPSSLQILNLYKLQSRKAYFTPYLSSAPSSYALALFYPKNAGGGNITYPVDIALDASDNAFVLYGSGSPGPTTATGLTVFDATGATLGYQSNSSYGYPSQIAVDTSGNAYITNNDSTTGAVLRGSYSSPLKKVATLANASGIAIDLFDNAWVSADSTSGNSFNEYNSSTLSGSSGSAAPDFKSNAIGLPLAGIAIDPDQDIWAVSNPTGGVATAVFLNNNSGSISAPTYTSNGYSENTLTSGAGFAVAVSGGSTTASNAYFPTQGQLQYVAASATSGSGGNTVITLSQGATASVSASKAPHRSQVDGNGTVFWTDLEGTGQLYMYTPGANPSVSAGTYEAIYPCYPVPNGSAYSCYTTSNNNLRATAIDSAGSLWIASSGTSTVIEILGVAAPTWPLLSSAMPAVEPQ